MRPRHFRAFGGVLAASLVALGGAGTAAGQENKEGGAALRTGPATVAPHWSKYKYPESVPEGATYYIIERGDTLWDLSKRYLGNPFLWPQIWDQNRYITDAHWIYPGDPLILPKIALISERAGEAGGEEGAFGYDFSQGYTSLERGIADAPTRPRVSWWYRWLQRRAARRLLREQEEREAEERRLDGLLEKVHREGRQALTDEEVLFMKRVSDRYRRQ